jgi:carbon storage regulator
MLVLAGRVGQEIFVGDDIVITIVRASKCGVRLGFQAPRDVNIGRDCVRKRDANPSIEPVGRATPSVVETNRDAFHDVLRSRFSGAAIESEPAEAKC